MDRRTAAFAFAALTAAAALSLAGGDAAAERKFTDRFDEHEWASAGENPYFVLRPGHTLTLEGVEDGEDVVLTITVLEETKVIDGVETRVVEERETEGGELAEVSRNYFAISKRTSGVYYFGEDVDEYDDGKVSGHPGSWHSGEKGAKFGLMVPCVALVGSRYHQEVAPGTAMDRAEILSIDERFECRAGAFERCLLTQESTPLEPKAVESKVYAPGVGLVQDGVLRLTAIRRAPAEKR